MNKTIEQLRREFFVARNEEQQAWRTFKKLCDEMTKYDVPYASESCRLAYATLAIARQAAESKYRALVDRERAAGSRLADALRANGVFPTFTWDGDILF